MRQVLFFFSILFLVGFPCYDSKASQSSQLIKAVKSACVNAVIAFKPSPDVKKIGILPIEGDKDDLVYEYLLVEILKSKKTKVIERKHLELVLEEQKLHISKIIDSESAVMIGNLSGAQGILFGKTRMAVNDSGDAHCRIMLQLVKVEDGAVIWAENFYAEESAPPFVEKQKNTVSSFSWTKTYEHNGYRIQVLEKRPDGFTAQVLSSSESMNWGIQIRSNHIDTANKKYVLNFVSDSTKEFNMALNIQPLDSPNCRGCLLTTDEELFIPSESKKHQVEFYGNTKRNRNSMSNNSLLHFKIGYAPAGSVITISNMEIVASD